MRRLVAVLSLYGLLSFLPILIVQHPNFARRVPGLFVRGGDLIDLLLTPLVGVGTYVLLYALIPAESDAAAPPPRAIRGLFWLLAILYIEGHGMHLAADAIRSYLTPAADADLNAIAFLFDEVISHGLWLGGALGLAGVASVHQRRFEARTKLSTEQLGLLTLSGALYGAGFGLFLLEGRVAAVFLFPLVIAALALVADVLHQPRRLLRRPVWAFFLPGFLTILLLFTSWWLRFGSFVEPSQVGWLVG